ncbi:MAG: PilZ domain-containing protein [Alphaproteobacteria bacterium]|nr:PilZ domain-containing protein [Alphaproteobacteria bacterium]
MFSALLEAVKSQPENDQFVSKRRHPRRETDRCVVKINGKVHPVRDWSMGGFLAQADSRPFGIDNEIEMTLMFKLREKMLEIPHKARVVRKGKETVAFEFLPIDTQIKTMFQNVVDDFVAGQFADSQI